MDRQAAGGLEFPRRSAIEGAVSEPLGVVTMPIGLQTGGGEANVSVPLGVGGMPMDRDTAGGLEFGVSVPLGVGGMPIDGDIDGGVEFRICSGSGTVGVAGGVNVVRQVKGGDGNGTFGVPDGENNTSVCCCRGEGCLACCGPITICTEGG